MIKDRDYEIEARYLEKALQDAGVIEQDTAEYSLINLVNLFGFQYSKYGALTSQPPIRGTSFVRGYEVFKQGFPPRIEPRTKVEIENAAFRNLDTFKPVVEQVERIAGKYPLSDDQKIAWEKIKSWVLTDDPYFVLRGYAGTGKTALVSKFKELGKKFYYSAPTNKATKVLSKAIKAPAKTIYSMLGLRMEQVDDKLVLTPGKEKPYFPSGSILVIDEASMCGSQLCSIIEQVRSKSRIKIIFVGDPAQLPPIGEVRSSAWSLAKKPSCKSTLKQVMRYDNQLLELATSIRKNIKSKKWVSPLKSNHSETEGVWKYKSSDQFERRILNAVADPTLKLCDMKVIAWRNKTVDYYNNIIRDALGFTDPFCIGDILLLAEPIEKDGSIIAHIDDEFVVEEITDGLITIDENIDIKVWCVLVSDGETSFNLKVPKSNAKLDKVLMKKASFARSKTGVFRTAAWKDFWKTKALFNKVRYGYAITAHRSQGSGYSGIVFVDQMDILYNPNKKEAFSCLYVAVTRSTGSLCSY